MSATINEITQDISRISALTGDTLSSSEEVSGAPTGLSELSRRLDRSVQRLKIQ
jgi:methyl-accepting chemotaxis protein